MRIILSIILFAGVIVLFTACIQKNETYTETAVLFDITDKQLAFPKADEILSLNGIDDKWNGIKFRYSTLSDVSQSKVLEAKLEPVNKWLSNEPKRNKDMKNFKNSVSDILSDTAKQSTGKNNSSVYIPIARELNHLAKSKAQRKILIVYSDLIENTEISFYRKSDLTLLKTKPEVIREQFEKLMSLPPLSGIEIYLVYEPADMKSDELFRIISGFYKKLLEDKGAKVNISANLNF